MQKSQFAVIDLFSGAGGFSLGAARAGFDVIGAVDSDHRAICTHTDNFPRSKHLELDISKITGDDLLKCLEIDSNSTDGIIAGPPCQGFSSIGRRDASDPRNNLFIKTFDLVASILPQFFIIENVPGILSSRYKDIIEAGLALVKDNYNTLPSLKLKANEFGAPTSRTRIFFIGFLKNGKIKTTLEDFSPPDNIELITVGKALKGLRKKIHPNWQMDKDGWRKVARAKNGWFGNRLQGVIPEGIGHKESLEKLKYGNRVSGCLGTRHTEEVLKRFSKVKPGNKDKISKAYRLEPNGFCPTIRAGTGSDRGSYQALRPLHPAENRVITPREAARLQGFPDWFKFDATKWHSFRQIGNSVSPLLSEHIMGVIKNGL